MDWIRLSGMAAGLSVFACIVGRAAAHEPPTGTGVYARGAQLVVRTSRGLVVSSSAERQDFRFLCNEALGVAEFDAPSVLVHADQSLLVGSSGGLLRVSADLCSVDAVDALGSVRVAALRADPRDSTHVYAATDAGLHESRDQGERFTQLDAHAFDSLEVPESAQAEVFAAGKLPTVPGQARAYFARWHSDNRLDLQDFALDAHEFGITLLGSDAQRVFAVAHAYLGTQYRDRLLVSSDSARSWQSPLSARGIAAVVIDPATGTGLVGSSEGLWRATNSQTALTQIRTDAVSCLARVSSRLYICDGTGPEGGMSESRDGGEHWRSVLRWNQVTGLAACPADAPAVRLCSVAWDDWQRELPSGPALSETNPVDRAADAGPVDTAQDMLQPARGCAAMSGDSRRATRFGWLWLALYLFQLRRLRTQRSHMSRTLHHVLISASLMLPLLSACYKHSSGSHTGPSSGDAAVDAAPDGSGSTSPNLLDDAAVSINAGSGSAGTGGAGSAAEQRAGSGSASSAESAGHAGVMSSAGAGNQAPAQMDAGSDSDSGPSKPQNFCTSCGGCEETQKVVSTMHTTNPVKYQDPPPMSGPHNPCWARYGIHDEPEHAERWVHNLEHGSVVFLYNCPQGCAAEVDILKDIVSKRSRTILTAYADLPARFAVVSWGRRIVSDCMDEQAFIEFYTRNFDHGPEVNASPPSPNCPP